MKKATTLKNIIGLTQDELAMYFGVTKGHWSMFVIGKRDLPLDSQEEKHPIDSFAESIRLRAMKTLKQHNLYSLTELQLKKESLDILKTTLEKKMKAFQM